LVYEVYQNLVEQIIKVNPFNHPQLQTDNVPVPSHTNLPKLLAEQFEGDGRKGLTSQKSLEMFGKNPTDETHSKFAYTNHGSV